MASGINYTEAGQKKGYLDISASEFYFNKVRPHIQDMLLTCKTDEELLRTLDKITNAADSFCIRKEYSEMMGTFDVFMKVTSGRNYFSGVIKNASDEEKEKIRKMIALVNDLSVIVQCEEPEEVEVAQGKERLDYNSPNGEFLNKGYNKSYEEHKQKLNASEPKKRIPNV